MCRAPLRNRHRRCDRGRGAYLRVASALLVGVLLLSGCAAGGQESVPRQSSPERTVSVPPNAETPVQEARRSLAAQLGTSPDAITVVAIDPRDWPDTSLGCPEPGQTYAQVVTPGYRVVLSHASRHNVFHTSMAHAVRCPSDPP